MNPSQLSEFLLEQFEAICSFERKVREKDPLIHPHQAKYWYHVGIQHLLEDHPWVVPLCKELEKTVPPDHEYWSTQQSWD